MDKMQVKLYVLETNQNLPMKSLGPVYLKNAHIANLLKLKFVRVKIFKKIIKFTSINNQSINL